jgi:hypothetical protein
MARSDQEQRPRKLLTRGQVARRLDVSIATVRRLEGTVLHPRTDEDGVRLFEAQEVERVALARSSKPMSKAATMSEGEVAAEAFKLFRQGYDLDEVVIRLKQPPRIVRQLFAEWTRPLL